MDEQPSTSNSSPGLIKGEKEILDSESNLHDTSFSSILDTSQDFSKPFDTSLEDFFLNLPEPDQVPHTQDFVELYDSTYK